MTQEEKAKAYDKAIKYAHYLINERCKKNTDGSFHRADLQRMFPALEEESEDERIELLNYLYDVHDDDEERARWIAWLEKQGEQKPWSEEDKNMLKWVTGYLNNKMLNTSISEERTACKNAIAWFEKLKSEQKPADIQSIEKRAYEVFPDDDDENTPFYRQAFIDGAVDYIDCGCKKSSAWSEEDEKMFECALDMIEWYSGKNEDKSRFVSGWLKSLKDRVTPQLKQKWSAEDEEQARQIERIIHHEGYTQKLQNQIADWFKSLKDRVGCEVNCTATKEWSEEDENGSC